MDTMGWGEGHFLTDWAVLAESLDSVKESLRLPRGPACALTQRRGGRGSRWTAPCRLRRPLHPQMRTRLEEEGPRAAALTWQLVRHGLARLELKITFQALSVV